MAKKTAPEKYAARYQDYKGSELWTVSHPEHRTVTVAAPDENSAIVAAATVWRVKWTAIEIYDQATVIRA